MKICDHKLLSLGVPLLVMAVSYSLIFYQMRSSRLLLEVHHHHHDQNDVHDDDHPDYYYDFRNRLNFNCGSQYVWKH